MFTLRRPTENVLIGPHTFHQMRNCLLHRWTKHTKKLLQTAVQIKNLNLSRGFDFRFIPLHVAFSGFFFLSAIYS